MSCRRASCESAILASWPTINDPHRWNFAANCSGWRLSFLRQKHPHPVRPGCVQFVVVRSPSSRGSQRRRLHGDSSQHVFQIRRNGDPNPASRCARARPRRRVSPAPSSRHFESCNPPFPSQILILDAHPLLFDTDPSLLPSPSRDHINPHSRTLSIATASAANASGFLQVSLSKVP